MNHLFFFGDSITLGVGEPEAGGWVGHFAAGLVAQGRVEPAAASFYNLGVRRASSKQVQARWEAEYRVRCGLPEVDTCRLLFCCGVVDMAAPTGRPNLGVDTSVATARAIVQTARELAPTVLLGPTPVADTAHAARIATLSRAYAALCAEVDVPFVELYASLAADPAYMGDLPDGIHPAGTGNARIAALLLDSPVVRRWLGG